MISGFFNIIANVILFTGYIVGNNSFPVPLTSSEEKEYINRFKSGDLNAKNILIERNLRLVVHIAKKFSSIKEVEDLISVGTIGLIKGIESFDYTKGTKLATYASRCIENEILMLIRNSKKNKNEVFLQEPIGVDKEGNEISLIDILNSGEDTIVDIVEQKLAIKKMYNKLNDILSEKEQIIIKLRYGLIDGKIKTQKEIAKKLNISRSYVSRIEKKALEKLNKELLFKK
ncbi:RNA polymerase sporulation sigma factor SigK [Candidatus Arthromitus sp. SFB-turkey]|uniref:RNA polymerase sporulation sigma factor SigK n=1 Tax=Candidatus Arthromitus sp. SFB-turkey TaxID=1840217 RepID=UPI0007F3C233|nr:RNA polymerase sporulation sigma factor SigK [Candidatus Arthromitus sp. SFB-turkey]OAT86856.1 RNA polymerase subunit sigma-70 [Candidatus Arthromitus sp. SFB-turkey]HJD00895.1 RNA polymerase sporulation sigma factor SigK [Candidatus Dwaynia gallinarum]